MTGQRGSGLSSNPARDLRLADPTGWGFLVSRRWAGYLAMTVVFALVCVGLGVWQLSRRAEAVAAIELVESNWDRSPVALSDGLPELDSFDQALTWLPVEVTGTYLHDEQLLVRNRPNAGQPGFEVLTPLRLEDGTIFVINRGWLPTGQRQDRPDSIPRAPDGEVTVVARLKAGEPALPGRGAGEGEIATIELPQIQERLGQSVYTGAFGLLASEDPAPAERPSATSRPQPDEGPHLSYAFQWFVFALLGFVGLGWAAREEYRSVNADDPQEQERARAREKKRRQKVSDADVEDEILDSRR